MTDHVLAVNEAAHALCKHGYHTTPVGFKSKAAILKDHLDILISTEEEVNRYYPPNKPLNIGLLVGTEVADGLFVGALDVDLEDDTMIQRIKYALGWPMVNLVSKKGSKGITFIVRSKTPLANKKLKRTLDDGKKVMALEVLGRRAQTVLPPSIHPETNEPYQWLERSLIEIPPQVLPEATMAALTEMELAVRKPDSPLFELNEMTWLGVGKGGTVDAALLTATGVMVQLGWVDEDIYLRCDRAVEACLDRADSQLALKWDSTIYRKRLDNVIGDARAKGFNNGRIRRTTPQERRIGVAEEFIAKLGGIENLWRDGPMLRKYSEGYWPEVDRGDLIHDILHYDRTWIEVNDAEQIARQILHLSPKRPRLPVRKICLLNGTLDMDDFSIADWSPTDFLISKLTVEWDALAVAPTWEKLVYDVFRQYNRDGKTIRSQEELTADQEKAVNLFEEFAGLTLVEDLSFQKMLIVLGPTRSGKTTLLSSLMMLHDPLAISSVPISKIHEDRMLTTLLGKIANISPEIRSDAYVDDAVIKSITGADPVTVRRLYEEATTNIVLPTRLMIACNEMFRINDTSGAMEERMIILNGGRTIPAEDRDTKLLPKIRQELPGILVRLAVGLRNLYERKRFLEPESSRTRLRTFSEENNQVMLWLKERTHQGMKMDDIEYDLPRHVLEQKPELARSLYADYQEWVNQSGFKQLSVVSWGTKISNLGFPVHVVKIAGVSQRIRYLNLITQGRY